MAFTDNTYNTLADEIYPGFSAWSVAEQNLFKDRVPTFEILIHTTLERIQVIKNIPIYYFLFKKEEDTKLSNQFNIDSRQLHETISDSSCYYEIAGFPNDRLFIEKKYPDFRNLDRAEQFQLVNDDAVRALISEMRALEHKIGTLQSNLWEKEQCERVFGEEDNSKLHNKLSELKEEEKSLIKQLRMYLNKEIYILKKLEPLARSIPLILFKEHEIEATLMELMAQEIYNKNLADPTPIIKQQLKSIVLHTMNAVSKPKRNLPKLDDFHEHLAQLLIEEIIKAFNQNRAIDWAAWTNAYKNTLFQMVHEKLHWVSGKPYHPKQIGLGEAIQGSLSSILKTILKNPTVENLASAHAVIQATCPMQSDSSYYAVIDVYNALKISNQVAEIKGILYSLSKPFRPLYDEYLYIAKHERSIVLKFIKSMVPLLIIIAFVTLIFHFFIVPLLLPELVIAAIFIPTLIGGIGLATGYVVLKNALYDLMQFIRYPDPLDKPAFKINERMKTIFKPRDGASDAEKTTSAESIKTFYIHELRRCEYIESRFKKMLKETGALLESQIDARKENNNRLAILHAEWIDIRNNLDLPADSAKKIALTQIRTTMDARYTRLRKNIHDNSDTIKTFIENLATEVVETLCLHADDADKPQTIPTRFEQVTFFKPRGKAELERLTQLHERFAPIAV